MYVVEYHGRSNSFPGMLGAVTHVEDLYESLGWEGQDINEAAAELFEAALKDGGTYNDGITLRLDAIARSTVAQALKGKADSWRYYRQFSEALGVLASRYEADGLSINDAADAAASHIDIARQERGSFIERNGIVVRCTTEGWSIRTA